MVGRVGERLILDAEPLGDRLLQLTVASPGGGLEALNVEAAARAYLLPINTDASTLARGVEAEGVEAWVEDWLSPPRYDRLVEVVVVEGGWRGVGRVASALEARGVARRVNRYPGPLVEVLWRLGLRPGCPLGRVCDPLEDYGVLSLAVVEAYSWHGPISSPLEKPGRLRVVCGGWEEAVGGVDGALDVLRGCRPHVVVARSPVRLILEGSSRFREYLWFEPDRNLVGPRGLIVWMRISWLPYTMAHGAPIGRVLTAAEAREAYRRRYLLDERAPRHERFRSLRSLVESDMPGAARLPEPGVYWGVVQLDYSSLYPRLIAMYNISAETVDTPCENTLDPAPGYGGHRVCMDRRGLVPEVLGRLVDLREEARRRGAGEEQEAIKWILVSGFGYLGFRNSLFGSITAYETVTAAARKALAAAEEAAVEMGYRVIHSLVDSVFIQPVEPRGTPREVAREIERRTGVPVKIEAEYKWLYIPPTLRGHGAVNKYYGALESGGVKLKGIAAVRRDTPEIVREAQASAIARLAEARHPGEWPGAVERAWKVIEGYMRLLREGEPPVEKLVIEKRVDPGSSRNTPWRRAWLKSPVQTPTVKYVVAGGGRPHPVWLGPPGSIDRQYYIKLLERAAGELPKPVPQRQA
ncbi:DNA polymerase II [Aeropyrum pernix]|uniref:DNA-directed DNA polymerase n=1 Tax=Aeropyrum pernix TaxID=56636 RepID=A0A401HAX6_AERPX|nr:DNA polymerase II [Aeropyrum pernix]